MSRNGSPRTTMEYWKNYLIEHKRSIRIYLVSYVLEGQNWGSTLIYSNQIMQNSQITDVCNDGEDNDSESIGKGYPSLTHRIHNEIDTRREESLKSHIWTLISNYLNKVGLNDQYTHSMEKDTVYIHTFLIYFCFFFLPAHTLDINKWAPLRIHTEMDMLSNNNVDKLSLTKWPSQLRISKSMSMRWK